MGTYTNMDPPKMGCCEKLAAFQLIISCMFLGFAGCAMMTYGIVVMFKVMAGFAVAIFSIGAFMLVLSIYGACFGSKVQANNRLFVFQILLIVALLAQVVLAAWYIVDPDVLTDAADKTCHKLDTSISPASCSTNATSWCEAASTSCSADLATCCCACDQDCQDCEESVESTRGWIRDHDNFVASCLWAVAGMEALALISACCKQSKASTRALNEPLLSNEEEVPQTQADLEKKYGVSFQVHTKSGVSIAGDNRSADV